MLFFSSATWVSIYNNKDKDTELLDREDKIDLLWPISNQLFLMKDSLHC